MYARCGIASLTTATIMMSINKSKNAGRKDLLAL